MESGNTAAGREPTSRVAQEQASRTAEEARSAAGDVIGTAREQARTVADESRSQVRAVAYDMRDRISEEAEHQTRRASENLRRWSKDLASMAERADHDSPARGTVRQAAERARGAADYLDERGPRGLLDEVQTFARRRPGAFLAGALAAGFLAGRLVKSAREAQTEGGEAGQDTSEAPAEQPRADIPPQYREVT